MSMKLILHCDYLTGGVNKTYLDYWDGNSLSEGDRAQVINSDTFYLYRLNATSGAAESSPNVISPDTNAGTKRWILITTYSLTSVTTSVTAADNTSSTAIATTAFAKSQDAVLAREPDQGVALTAAASGSSGITVADNDNIDFGTGNFAPYFDGLVPDFTPAANLILMQKLTGGVGYQLEIVATTGIIRLTLNATAYNSSVAPTATDGTRHKIVPVVTVGAVNTTVDFYFDGVALGTQQTAANPGTVSNAAALYILGTSAVRTAGTVNDSGTLNFAPTAAEVLDMYRNGIPESWKDGSQTAQTSGTLVVGKQYVIDNWITNDDFTNVGGVNVDGTRFIATGTTPTTWTNSSSVRRAGPTLNLQPENIQNNRWLDATSNHLDATFPTTGWSLTRPMPYEHPVTQLLTNSQWMAMSGSTLENVGSQIVTGWTNDSYETFTTSGANVTSAINSSGYGIGFVDAFTALTAGKLYEVAVTLTLNSGTAPSVYTTSAAGNSGQAGGLLSTLLVNGANSICFEATGVEVSMNLYMGSGVATDYAATITLYEVTPGYVAADTLAPDGGTKTTTLDLHQYWNCASANTYGYGKYLMKATKGADSAEYWNLGSDLDYRQAQGQPVAIGCWVYAVQASNVKLSIHDGVSEIALSSTYCPAGAITWMEVTGTMALTASAFTPRILFDGATSDVAYISPVMGVRGNAIGRGNYQPIVNEVIWLQTKIDLLSGYSPASGATSLNMEALSSGKIGKGVKSIIGILAGANTAAGQYLHMYDTDSVNEQLMLYCQVNSGFVSTAGTMKMNSSGDCVIKAQDANWNNVLLRINAIQN